MDVQDTYFADTNDFHISSSNLPTPKQLCQILHHPLHDLSQNANTTLADRKPHLHLPFKFPFPLLLFQFSARFTP